MNLRTTLITGLLVLMAGTLYMAFASDSPTVTPQVSPPFTFTLLADGCEVCVPAVGATLADALDAAGIAVGKLDRISLPETTNLKPGLKVEITRVSCTEVKQYQVLPFETLYKDSRDLRPGEVKVEQQGKPGLLETVREVWTKNGQVTLSKVTGGKVLTQPESRIVLRGARTDLSSRGFDRSRRVVRMTATAYSASPSQNGGWSRTATGLKPRKGIVAVDPRVIPLGTQLYIEGYGYALAADTGGAIKGNRIDLCFQTNAECIRFGRRTVTVHILD